MAKAIATIMKNGNVLEHREFSGKTYGEAYANASFYAQQKARLVGGTWRVTRSA